MVTKNQRQTQQKCTINQIVDKRPIYNACISARRPKQQFPIEDLAYLNEPKRKGFTHANVLQLGVRIKYHPLRDKALGGELGTRFSCHKHKNT